MDLNHLWIKRENADKSVSLTLVIASALICWTAAGLEMANVVKSTSITFEMFMACATLHFGRTWVSSKGAQIGDNVKEDK